MGPRSASPLPNVFLGSHDPLLDWALRESGAGLATFCDGSLDGLARFAAREGVGAGVHIFAPEDGTWNLRAVAEAGFDAVLIAFATRRRGLISRPDAPVTDLAALAGRRVAPRQAASGSEGVFAHLLAQAGVAADAFTLTAPMRSEADAALAVANGEADATFGLQALAEQHGLAFAPVIEERFDLLLDRRAYFEPPLQRFLAFCRTHAFAARAETLAGYDVSECGMVRWNGG